MNKFKVGQKVKIIRTGKIGEIKNIINEDFNKMGCSYACYKVYFIHKVYYIQEDDWDWFTVHDLEEVKEILDAEEKEYLSNIIKPFRDRVNLIRKSNSKLTDDYYEVIEISIKSLIPYWECEAIVLPAFKSNLYKGMELCKAYTLEELGL